MEFKRGIEKQLYDWKLRVDRKPLVISGARQVGKTTLVSGFAKTYKHAILLNLEKSSDRYYFDNFQDVHTIVEALFLVNKIPSSDLSSTLLFIDEIQEDPKAIQLLRYFYEEIPDLHVISASSLLEFAIKAVESFPVGRVEYLYLYPLNFKEYLEAIGSESLIKELTRIPVKQTAHKILMDLFHRYAIIGGMPEVVKTDVKMNSLSDLPRVYESIWETYKNDVEKYSTNESERMVIKTLMETAPLFVDERVKFQGFGNTKYRSREVGEAFRTLDESKIIRLIYPTTDLNAPLRADLKKSPRLQFVDTGLVNYALAIQGEMLPLTDLNSAYKGAIISHLIAQEVISINSIKAEKPFFWVRGKSQSSAKVDLLFTYMGMAIPIAIKSGAKGSLRSLHQFIDATDHLYAIRMYAGEFKVEQARTPNKKPYLLMSLPYYCGTVLPEYIDWFLEQELKPL